MFKNKGQMDLTKGNPLRQIVLFSIPLVIGNFIQQLYSTVDAIVVSRYIGDHALGAVGASFPIINFLIIIFVAISTGTGVLAGQYYGAKEREKLSRTVGNCSTWVFYISIALVFVALVVTDPILRLMQTPEEIFAMTSVYLKTIFVGGFGSAYYNILTGLLRALGDSMFPLYTLVISTVINIVLDIVFVKDFGMGVFGVAFATVIAQTISALLCMYRLHSLKDIFDTGKKYLKMDREISKKMFGIGLPNAITQGVFSVAMLFLQRLYNSFGPAVVTASSTVMRIDGFVMLPIFTFGIAATTFTSQNIGAKQLDRVKEGTVAGLKVALASSITLALLIFFFGLELGKIFTNTDEILGYTSEFLRILAIGHVMFTFTQVLGGVMRGAGDSVTPMWISIFSVVIVRTPLSYILVEMSKTATLPQGNPAMVTLGHCISWVTGGLLSIVFYRLGNWKKKIYSIVGETEKETEELKEETVNG